MNLHDLFAIPRQRTPDKAALRCLDQLLPVDNAADPQTAKPQTLTYQELFAAADRLAAGLQDWGLQKGDRVAFYIGSRPELVIAYLAVIRLGAIVVPINLRYRRLEIGHILSDCTPRMIITEQAQLAVLDEVGEERATIEATLLAEELPTWEMAATSLAVPVVHAEDLALIIYTSGTTGRSKGAMISHNNVIATVTALLAAWAWHPQDKLLLCLPLFHTHGLIVGLHCALAAGATVLLRAKYDDRTTVDDLLSGEPTLFFAVPTIYVRLVEALQQRPKPDLSHMRLFCSGSAPLAAETHSAFEALTGHIILERYGMTETGMNLSNHYAGPRIAGSVGTPLPGVFMRIVDNTNQDVEAGSEGELLVRGSNVFSGYWNAPEKTAESFSHDTLGQQWFHTGDLARQDPTTGYVTLLGRRHELIISGGFNIYPREIEEMLTTFPGITEAAVVGEPHPQWGEVPIAYLVGDATLDTDALVQHCRGLLASFKVPQAFHFVPELPRNAMGKLQKHLLK
ncbi:MAG TPA: AMP-binding protein [Caldilineaceae bacterium]|nr:AMP-binding protein [Caldilineaceae bacterium]